MKSKKGKECAEMLQNKLFGPFGAPRVLVSDNGGVFVSEIVEAVLLMNNTTHCTTTAYHPQSNGMVERLNRTLKQRLRAMMETSSNWDEHVQRVVDGYNRSIHSATGFAPFLAYYGREPMMPTRRMLLRGDDQKFDRCRDYVNELLEKLVPMYDEIESNNQKSWEKSRTAYDRRNQVWIARKGHPVEKKAFEFKVGDKVWKSMVKMSHGTDGEALNSGLHTRWRGPLVIMSRTGNTYRVGAATGGVLPKSVSADQLRPYRAKPGLDETSPDVREDRVNWDAPHEAVLHRNELVQGRANAPRQVEVLKGRMGPKLGSRPRRKLWRVLLESGRKEWVDDGRIQKRALVSEYLRRSRWS